MSIEQKFSGMSAEYKKDKESFIIKNDIQKLEERKRNLELIKNSLELESGQEIEGSTSPSGEGMKENIEKIAFQKNQKEQNLNKLITDNRELLAEVFKVQDIEGLSKNKELLNKVPEIKEHTDSYNKDIKDVQELDGPLLKRLESLGVETGKFSFLRDFSYQQVITAIDEKLRDINAAIGQEELKLEGKNQEKERAKQKIEKAKEEINEFLSGLENIESELPDEEIEFIGATNLTNDYELKIPSISTELASLYKDITKKDDNVMEIHNKYKRLKHPLELNSTPEDKEELRKLEEEEERENKENENEIEKLNARKDELIKKRKVVVTLLEQYPTVSKSIEITRFAPLEEIKGKPNEIFKELKERLKKTLERLSKETA